MAWQYTPYILLLLLGTLISVGLAMYAWQRQSVPGAASFIVLVLAIAGWCLGYSLEILSIGLSAKIFWGKVQYFGITTLPVAWLTFALQYTRRESWLTRRNLLLLAIIPLITVLLVWTNGIHGLVWSEVTLDRSGPFPAMSVHYGLWFWVHLVYSYMLLLLGTLMLIRMVITFPDLYRWQAILLLFGAIAPWIGNIIYVFGLTPVPNLDFTPLVFSLSGVTIGLNLFRFGFFDIVPVARRAIVDSMSDAVIVLDLQNRIVDLNPAAQRLIGYPGSDAIGRTGTQALSSWAELLSQFRDQREARTELVKYEPDGPRHFEVQISSLLDQQEKPTGSLIVVRDITGRKEAEQALRDSEKRFRQVVSSISDHIYMTEFAANGHQSNLYISPNVATLTGYPLEKFTGDWNFWPTVVIHPDDRASAAKQVERFAQGKNSETEYRMTRADGEVIWVRDSGTVEKEAGGQGWVVYGVVSDITERKRAEQALLTSEAKFRTLAETISSGIFIHAGQEFKYVNSAAETLTGYSQAELMTLKFWDLVHPEFKALVKERALARLADPNQPPPHYELKMVRKEGQTRWVDLTTSVIDFEGQTAVLGTVFDITARKQTEEALSVALEQAQEASQLKTQLLANVSHDLRTPLNAILGYTEMLQEGLYGPLSSRQEAATAEIIDSTGQLLDFINNLLSQAELESGRVKLNIVDFSPAALLETMHSAAGTMARAKGLTLTTEIADNVPPTVPGDPYWLRQILANLVNNALKFTDRGRVDVSIRCPNAHHWAIVVADTGCGIPQEALPYIFESFERASGAAPGVHVGSGLGLSIVKNLVYLMGGHVNVDSDVGQGSTFTILLPLASVREKQA